MQLVGFSRDSNNCVDSLFLVHCSGCTDCFGCVGLHKKQYHIFNQPHSKEDYFRKLAELNTGSLKTVDLARDRVGQLIGAEVVKNYHGFGCENVTGDYLYNCKNVFDGYDLKNCEDCRHCTTLESYRDCQDCNFSAVASELSYNCLTSYGYRLISCQSCMAESSDLAYCDNCYSCKDCIGCVGLNKKRYCILNRQYSKEEYETLAATIIKQLRETGEWGKFFPVGLSPFAYNETMAWQYFPLTREEALQRGWRWKDEPRCRISTLGDGRGSRRHQGGVRCNRAAGVAVQRDRQALQNHPAGTQILPRDAAADSAQVPDQRHAERMQLRNPRKLWKRQCAKCNTAIETTYAPNHPEPSTARPAISLPFSSHAETVCQVPSDLRDHRCRPQVLR